NPSIGDLLYFAQPSENAALYFHERLARMDAENERSLIERAKKDPEAFGILFEQHYSAIFRYVFRRIEDWDVSKDITSEVLFKAFKGLWRYRWQGIPFSSWLYRIATNEVRMYL